VERRVNSGKAATNTKEDKPDWVRLVSRELYVLFVHFCSLSLSLDRLKHLSGGKPHLKTPQTPNPGQSIPTTPVSLLLLFNAFSCLLFSVLLILCSQRFTTRKWAASRQHRRPEQLSWLSRPEWSLATKPFARSCCWKRCCDVRYCLDLCIMAYLYSTFPLLLFLWSKFGFLQSAVILLLIKFIGFVVNNLPVKSK
jgi:hypothetical protein